MANYIPPDLTALDFKMEGTESVTLTTLAFKMSDEDSIPGNISHSGFLASVEVTGYNAGLQGSITHVPSKGLAELTAECRVMGDITHYGKKPSIYIATGNTVSHTGQLAQNSLTGFVSLVGSLCTHEGQLASVHMSGIVGLLGELTHTPKIAQNHLLADNANSWLYGSIEFVSPVALCECVGYLGLVGSIEHECNFAQNHLLSVQDDPNDSWQYIESIRVPGVLTHIETELIMEYINADYSS